MNTHPWWIRCVLATAILLSPAVCRPMALPADGGQLDVRAFGAIPSDGVDDTDAIQAALDALTEQGTVYLPAGTYRISRQLRFPEGPGHVSLIGEAQGSTVIRLANHSPGFTDPSAPLAMLWGPGGNMAFGHWIHDLTFDTGSGNCGAIGLDVLSSNRGGFTGVTVRSGDASKCGVIGIDLRRQWPGPMLLQRVTVRGFDKALETGTDEYGVAIDQMTISGQRLVGLEIYQHLMAVRRLTSTNLVPAVQLSHWTATLALLDSTLSGGDPSTPAVIIEAADPTPGVAYLRNVSATGYARLIEYAGSGVEGLSVAEWTSIPPVVGFSDPAQGALKLAVPNPPSIAYPPAADWVNIAGGDAQAIQAGIDAAASAGKTTVYLPSGEYVIDAPLTIHGSVQRLIGLTARLRIDGALLAAGGPHLRVVTPGRAVSIEHVLFDTTANIPSYTVLDHTVGSTVTFRHCGSTGGEATLRMRGTGGRLFVFDFSTAKYDLRGANRTYVWNWNEESESASTARAEVHDGATFWALLHKAENDAVTVRATNGAKAEVIGHFNNWGDESPEVVDYISDEASITVAALRWMASILASETRGGVTRTVSPSSHHEALYVGSLP